PQKTEALRGLEMGNVVKLAFAFNERFWSNALSDDTGFVMTPGEPFKTFWTGYPLYAPVLLAWAGGPAADALLQFGAAERADRALESPAHVLGVSRADVDRHVVGWEAHDWAADPYARGAYSYVRVDGMAAQAAFAQPIAGTLFFAGEATELEGRQATVHG